MALRRSKRNTTTSAAPDGDATASGPSSDVTVLTPKTASVPAKGKGRGRPAITPEADSCEGQIDNEEEDSVEVTRLGKMLGYERKILSDERLRLAKEGCTDIEAAMQKFVIIGTDEVGVGPLAGPCVSAAVVLQVGVADRRKGYNYATLAGINDSKQIKADLREHLCRRIKETAMAHHLGICTSQEVDQLNPRAASMEAMRRAVTALLDGPLKGYRAHLLVDYHTVPGIDASIGQTCLEKGDAKSQSIAAASIVAKVYRDAYMLDLHQRYPQFGFDKNVGYGTAVHMAALRDGQLCPEHRLSFAPVRRAYEAVHGPIVPDVADEQKENMAGPSAKGRKRAPRVTADKATATRKRSRVDQAPIDRPSTASAGHKQPLKARSSDPNAVVEPSTPTTVVVEAESDARAMLTRLTSWLVR